MERSRGRGPTLAKDINRKLVYHQIKQRRTTSRVEVAKLLHLNKNTVNTIVDEFMAAGFIRELGPLTTNTAGRKPILIHFHGANKWSIGVQLTSTVIHWTITDLYANPLDSYSIPLVSSEPESVIAALAAGINRLTDTYSAADCIGMCLGIPGLIEVNQHNVIRSSHLGWHDVPIMSMLQSNIHIPLQLDNSVKLASLGELWHGSGQGLANFAYCYFGNGVGCGLIVNGAIVRGDTHAAGELGHIVIDPQGPLCGCGNSGCLEALVSIPSLLRHTAHTLSKPENAVTLEWLLSEWASGNPLVAAQLEQAGHYIGQALSYMANLLNPKLIICDGPLMQASSVIFPAIQEELKQRCVSITADHVIITRSKLYPLASCIGAAASAIQTWEESMDSIEWIT